MFFVGPIHVYCGVFRRTSDFPVWRFVFSDHIEVESFNTEPCDVRMIDDIVRARSHVLKWTLSMWILFFIRTISAPQLTNSYGWEHWERWEFPKREIWLFGGKRHKISRFLASRLTFIHPTWNLHSIMSAGHIQIGWKMAEKSKIKMAFLRHSW